MYPLENNTNTINDSVMKDINFVHIPVNCVIPDHPHWALNSKGIFNIKSMYEMIRNADKIPSYDSRQWNWIWRLKLPQKLKNFLWLIQHDRTRSNKLRYDRHISQEERCLRSNANVKDTLHILRDCPKAVDTWKMFTDDNYRNANAGLDIT